MRAFAALLCLALLGACNGPGPGATGIAAGLERDARAPKRPLADPSTATFAFEPVPGIPGNVGDDLLRRIWKVADDEGLNVVKRPGGRATFFVDGNMSAVSDDFDGLVFYVFNVRDVAGRRLYRIYGQQTIGDSDGDPFVGVGDNDLEVIARRVVVLLKAWLNADD
jgi:hypothetical protein